MKCVRTEHRMAIYLPCHLPVVIAGAFFNPVGILCLYLLENVAVIRQEDSKKAERVTEDSTFLCFMCIQACVKKKKKEEANHLRT